MIVLIDAPAIGAFVTTINRRIVRTAFGILAIERLGQRPRHRFQLKGIRSREQVCVRETILLQASLEQIHYLSLFWEVAEHDRI